MAYVKVRCSSCGTAWWAPSFDQALGKPHTECKGRGLWVTPDDVALEGLDADEASATGRPKPFRPNENFFMWSRGTWRGWAVAVLDEVLGDNEFYEMRPHYADKHLPVLDTALAEEIRAGKTYVLDPDQVIAFVIMQLGRFKPDSTIEEALDHLTRGAELLCKWKESKPNGRLHGHGEPDVRLDQAEVGRQESEGIGDLQDADLSVRLAGWSESDD